MMNRFLIFSIILSLTVLQVKAAITLPKLVSDNMVLQRDVPVHIWGWANAREQVVVTFKSKQYHTVASAEGKWSIHLAVSQAGGPYQMKLQGTNTIFIKNIVIGEVWLCSGQSNMGYTISEGIHNQQLEIERANYPLIRLIKIDPKMSLHPEQDISSSGWQLTTPGTVNHFAATAYFFGKDLYTRYKVPIGLITAAWGGTPIEAWLDYDALKQVAVYRNEVIEQQHLAKTPKGYYQREEDRFKQWMNEVDKADSGFAAWAKPGLNTIGWKTINLPGFWEGQGFEGFDGIAWLRKEVELPFSFAGKHLKLSIGSSNDVDFTYFNGELIGQQDGWNTSRQYTVPARLVKMGTNIITVRMINKADGGGLFGAKDSFNIASGNENILIAGEWKIKTALPVSKFPPYPGGLKRWYQLCGMYNGMIAPAENFTIKGITWYQGESNVRNSGQYRQLFALLISTWRSHRGSAQLPFLFVQLPNIANTSQFQAHDTAWAPLREAQLECLSLTTTGMAVMIDDDGESLHPQNKQLVGKRLAMLARKIAYHEKIVATGPLYKAMLAKADYLMVSFNETGTGLKIKHGDTLKGFEIAGDDKIFVPAIATIVHNQVLVKNNAVKIPKAVRYNWANNPGGNLYNNEGFPASPFRVILKTRYFITGE